MKYFISIIMTVVTFSTINAQIQTRVCSEILRFTYTVNEEVKEENGKYIVDIILQVPVEYNQWLLDHGYDIEETVYVKGNGESVEYYMAIDEAKMDARGNAACLGYEEIRDTHTVEKGSWEEKSFLKKLFRKQ